MKTLSMFTVVLFLVSCSTDSFFGNNRAKIEAEKNATARRFAKQEREQLHPIETSKTPIADEFNNPKNYQIFKKEICVKGADCPVKYRNTAIARMREKYTKSNVEKVNNSCAAHPVECKSIAYIEGLFVQSEESEIEIERKRKNDIYNEKRMVDIAAAEERARERNRDLANGLSDLSNSLKQNEQQKRKQVVTDCYTENHGNTQCRSN
jgi:hypothetical protein